MESQQVGDQMSRIIPLRLSGCRIQGHNTRQHRGIPFVIEFVFPAPTGQVTGTVLHYGAPMYRSLCKKSIFFKVGVRHIWGVTHRNTITMKCDELFEFVTYLLSSR